MTQQSFISRRHYIAHFIRRRAYNGLQPHLTQQLDAFDYMVAIHIIERFVKYHKTYRIAEAGLVVDTVYLSK